MILRFSREKVVRKFYRNVFMNRLDMPFLIYFSIDSNYEI